MYARSHVLKSERLLRLKPVDICLTVTTNLFPSFLQ